MNILKRVFLGFIGVTILNWFIQWIINTLDFKLVIGSVDLSGIFQAILFTILNFIALAATYIFGFRGVPT